VDTETEDRQSLSDAECAELMRMVFIQRVPSRVVNMRAQQLLDALRSVDTVPKRIQRLAERVWWQRTEHDLGETHETQPTSGGINKSIRKGFEVLGSDASLLGIVSEDPGVGDRLYVEREGRQQYGLPIELIDHVDYDKREVHLNANTSEIVTNPDYEVGS